MRKRYEATWQQLKELSVLSRFGDPMRVIKMVARIRVLPTGCWEWQAGKDEDGYGISPFLLFGTQRAHRVTYYFATGEWPPLLDHIKCDKRDCVNPEHVIPSTQRDNALRGHGPTAVNHRKTHCPQGHEYTADNLVKKGGHNWRQCKTCHRLSRDRK